MHTFDKTADVVVVGAGPGGCAAAISAAQAGRRVVLIEGTEFPRFRPGESLHPAIETLMRQLGCDQAFLAAGFTRFEGIHLRWNQDSRFQPFGSDEHGPWLGFQAVRSDFDAMLLDHARSVGVEAWQPCRAIRPMHSGDRVCGLETTRGTIAARYLIDAAGGNHWLARQLGEEIVDHSPRLIARYGYSKTSPYEDHQLPAIVADDQGWTWYAKLRDEHYHWTRLNLCGGIDEKPETDSELFRRGANVTWRAAAKPSGLGYFLVGDAAAVLDPASSHGVLRAVMSGMMASHAIVRIEAQPGNERELTKEYSEWLLAWFEHDANHLRELYSGLSITLGSSPFDQSSVL